MNDVLISINNKEAHISQEAYQIFLDRESELRNESKQLKQRIELLEGLLRDVSEYDRHPDYDWHLETAKAVDAALKKTTKSPEQ